MSVQILIDQTVAATPKALQIGERLSEYILLEKIGEGAFGDVWRAEHISNGRVAAIKIFAPDRFKLEGPRSAIERFIDGVKAMRKLDENDTVISLYEGPTLTDGHLWFAMKYYANKDLERWLKQHPDTTYEIRQKILDDVLLALTAAHAVGVIHRDVRPGNILIDDTNGIRAILADFDIAYFEEFLRKRERTLAMVGWPRYIPPDVFRATGEALSEKMRRPANDLYALSVVALDLFAGKQISIPDRPSPRSFTSIFPVRDSSKSYGLTNSARKRLASFFALALSTESPPLHSVAEFRLAWASAVTSSRNLLPLILVPLTLVALFLTTADWANDHFRDSFPLRVLSTVFAALGGVGSVIGAFKMSRSLISGSIPPWRQRLNELVSIAPKSAYAATCIVAAVSAGTAWKLYPRERAKQVYVSDAKACIAVDAQGRLAAWIESSDRTLLDISTVSSLRCPEKAQPAIAQRSWLSPVPIVNHATEPSGKINAHRISPTSFVGQLGERTVQFSLLGVRVFDEAGTKAPVWNDIIHQIEVSLPIADEPMLVVVRDHDVNLGEQLLEDGWLRLDASKRPLSHYGEIEHQAQNQLNGNWKLIDEQKKRAALLAQCPDQCCAGVLCEEKTSCSERWRCSFCRDGDNGVSWRIRLERVTIEHPEEWTNVKVCLSVGDEHGLNCVLKTDEATELGTFDGAYTRRKVSNVYLTVLGTDKANLDQRIGHKTFSFRVDPKSLCNPWGITDFVIRNGGVRSVVLSMHGPLVASRARAAGNSATAP